MVMDLTVLMRDRFYKKEKDKDTRLSYRSVALDFYSRIWEGEKYSLF